jgi:Na+-driven multidrug efflux pump
MIAVYSIALIGILCALNRPMLSAMSATQTKSSDPELSAYYAEAHSEQIKLASDYTLVFSGGLILTMFTVFFSSLIKSEGRFKLVAITGIVCNILSIALVVLFIYVAKIGIVGGALGNVVSFFINLGVLLIYLWILNKRKDTWLAFNTLLFRNGVKFNNRLIMPVVMVGLAAFLIDASYALATGVYIPILANTAADTSIFPRAQGDGMYFQTIEGATLPTLNLIFVTIYGIIEGERLIVAYNYSQGNWKRIKKTYALTLIISFVYSAFCAVVIAIGLNQYILKLFDIHNSPTFPRLLKDAELVFSIQILMLPIFSLQAAAISIYMSIGDTVRSNISSIFQDVITFFPVLGICYGITMGTHSI